MTLSGNLSADIQKAASTKTYIVEPLTICVSPNDHYPYRVFLPTVTEQWVLLGSSVRSDQRARAREVARRFCEGMGYNEAEAYHVGDKWAYGSVDVMGVKCEYLAFVAEADAIKFKMSFD